MAKDDYFVIVYQILAYLYRCLKDGEQVQESMLRHDSPLLNINETYWSYVIEMNDPLNPEGRSTIKN